MLTLWWQEDDNKAAMWQDTQTRKVLQHAVEEGQPTQILEEASGAMHNLGYDTAGERILVSTMDGPFCGCGSRRPVRVPDIHSLPISGLEEASGMPKAPVVQQLDTLVQAIEGEPDSDSVWLETLSSLRKLASISEHKPAVWQHNNARLMLLKGAAMKRADTGYVGVKSPEVREAALLVLGSLSMDGLMQRPMWASSSLREALLHNAAASQQAEGPKKAALGILHNLTVGRVNKGIWEHAGIRDALIAAAALGQSPALRAAALGSLCNLSADFENHIGMWWNLAARSVLIETGAGQQPTELRVLALGAMCNLAHSQENALMMWADGEMQKLLMESASVAQPPEVSPPCCTLHCGFRGLPSHAMLPPYR